MDSDKKPLESLFGLLKDKVTLERPVTIAEMNPASLGTEDRDGPAQCTVTAMPDSVP